MSDNKKYYYLKLKDNFFDSDEMIILESMQDGYMYSNILLKLYLRSLKYDGRLMFNERIPFDSRMLATVTRHSVGVVEKAMDIFQELGLVEKLDNGAIYMLDVQNYIGESSTEADRKRLQRSRIENEKLLISGQMSGQMTDKYPPEIEIELELKIDKEIKKESSRFTPPTLEEASNYCKERNNGVDPQRFIDYNQSKGWIVGKVKMKDWKAAIRTWEKKEQPKGASKEREQTFAEITRRDIANRPKVEYDDDEIL